MTLGAGDCHRQPVDDAVVGVENVLRRLQNPVTQRQFGAKRLPVLSIGAQATLEVRSVTVRHHHHRAVFCCRLVLPGMEGRLYPAGLAFIVPPGLA